jgi:hypothetical protein
MSVQVPENQENTMAWSYLESPMLFIRVQSRICLEITEVLVESATEQGGYDESETTALPAFSWSKLYNLLRQSYKAGT